jgi:hypothetical protein
MGNRYYITGVQLGMILGMLNPNTIEQIKKIIEEIETNQFIGTIEEENKNIMKIGIVKK